VRGSGVKKECPTYTLGGKNAIYFGRVIYLQREKRKKLKSLDLSRGKLSLLRQGENIWKEGIKYY